MTTPSSEPSLLARLFSSYPGTELKSRFREGGKQGWLYGHFKANGNTAKWDAHFEENFGHLGDSVANYQPFKDYLPKDGKRGIETADVSAFLTRARKLIEMSSANTADLPVGQSTGDEIFTDFTNQQEVYGTG